jgi:hypothetical protein
MGEPKGASKQTEGEVLKQRDWSMLHRGQAGSSRGDTKMATGWTPGGRIVG